eukprot:scaffold2875_cov247-Pinguiococcus_pyrenoidosus.AAC.5
MCILVVAAMRSHLYVEAPLGFLPGAEVLGSRRRFAEDRPQRRGQEPPERLERSRGLDGRRCHGLWRPWPGFRVRQPRRVQSVRPAACCDYCAAAGPYRARFTSCILYLSSGTAMPTPM